MRPSPRVPRRVEEGNQVDELGVLVGQPIEDV